MTDAFAPRVWVVTSGCGHQDKPCVFHACYYDPSDPIPTIPTN